MKHLIAVLAVVACLTFSQQSASAGGQCFVQQQVFAQPQFVQPQFAQQQVFAQPQFVQQRFVQPRFVQQRFVQPQFVQQRQPILFQRRGFNGGFNGGLLQRASLFGAFGKDAQRFSVLRLGLGF